MPDCGTNGSQFGTGIAVWLLPSRGAQRLPDPFSHSHLPGASRTAQIAHLGRVEQNLKSLSHDRSMNDSSR